MASIKGIIVEIGGDTSGLQKALSKVNSSTSSLSKELKGINSLLKLDPKNTELLSQKQTVLKQNIEQTSKKLEELRKAQEMADETIKNGGEISEENYRNLQREIINTENKLKQLKVEASKWTTAGRSIEEFGNKITNISNKIDKMGTTLTTRLTLPIAGIATLLTKSAMEQETAVQQIDNIYGEASETIKSFAENTALSYNMSTKEAYKYSQVFGNLIQSITDDQKENAQYTQELLKASSVIASSTGRTMEDVMDRIRSGLLGNTEAIEDLGINVNVALLESTDAFKKFAGDKSWNQLDFQTQQQIRLFGILEQTTKKYGDEINDNTSSSLQKVTAKFNNLTNKLGKNLLPVANKLLDVAEKGIDELEDLSDEEIENITNIVLFVASIGPAIKIVGMLGKTLGSGIKTVGSFSQAISLMGKTSTEAFKNASTGTQTLAKALTFMKSPAGIATMAITTLAGTLIYLALKETEAQKKAREFAEEMANQKQEYEDYNKSIDKTTSSNLAQINSVSKLKDELMTLVDENGKVKEGYESRVDFILNQLNGALETEYKRNENVVDSYKDLQSEIDKTIEKKKAEIVLNAKEEKYKNAIENQTEAVENLKTAHDKLGMSIEDAKKKREELNDKMKELEKSGDIYGDYLNTGKEKQALDDLIVSYENAENTVKQCTEDKKAYENDYALFVEGKYDEVGKTIKDTTKNWTDSSLKDIQSAITQEKQSLNDYKQIYENTGNEIALQQQEQSEQNLQNLANELAERTSTIGTLGIDEVSAWKTLANSSYEEYKNALAKVGPTTQQEIQKATGVIVSDTGLETASEDEAYNMTTNFENKLKLSDKTKVEISDSATALKEDTTVEDEAGKLADRAQAEIASNDSTIWGEDMVTGLGQGIKKKSEGSWFKGILAGLAGGIASYIHFSRPDKGPLREYEKWMPDMIQGLAKTLDNSSPKLLNSTQNLSKKIEAELNNMNMPKIQDFGKLQRNLSNQIIDSTKTIFTTPNLTIYTQEFDARKIANEVNRIFGSQY